MLCFRAKRCLLFGHLTVRGSAKNINTYHSTCDHQDLVASNVLVFAIIYTATSVLRGYCTFCLYLLHFTLQFRLSPLQSTFSCFLVSVHRLGRVQGCCPNWDHPLTRRRMCPLPFGSGGGGTHSLCGGGGGRGSNSDEGTDTAVL